MQDIYLKAKEFKSKFPRTIAWRLHKHAAVVQKHLHDNEKVHYVFCGQKNVSSLMINKTCIVAITDERLVIITTGSQGETMSALKRMAEGEHRK